uniref:Nuclear receptor 2C2-associated protein n=1 Tax=Salvator merianae TaxID=96440 RepID=A0A8D0AWS0_SALMN
MSSSLICENTVRKVSSVFQHDTKHFGKNNMFDGNEETCWNSDQGVTQWVTLEFPHTVRVSQIRIQFQGGFASEMCTVKGCRKGEELSHVAEFHPEETSSLQSFSFKETQLDKMKIIFDNNTDFFGRLIIYQLDVRGEKV